MRINVRRNHCNSITFRAGTPTLRCPRPWVLVNILAKIIMDIRADIDRVAHDHLLSGSDESTGSARSWVRRSMSSMKCNWENGLHLPSAKTMIRLLVKDINWHAEATCSRLNKSAIASRYIDSRVDHPLRSRWMRHSAECRLEQNEGRGSSNDSATCLMKIISRPLRSSSVYPKAISWTVLSDN